MLEPKVTPDPRENTRVYLTATVWSSVEMKSESMFGFSQRVCRDRLRITVLDV